MFDSTTFLKTLTHEPGVYQMFDADNKLIYVGKAKDLKKRVSSYFRKNLDSAKTQVMVQRIAHIEVIVTRSEVEALLLENTLIKKHRPRYNIWFRDDKTYPYLYLSTQKTFPQLLHYRGVKGKAGDYFGPYPSGMAVHQTLKLFQKVFKLRNCSDTYFAHRSRPCLQYQIQRCSAPCVGYISAKDYKENVEQARLLLQGKEEQVIDELIHKMQIAAEKMDFEKAAYYRDQINDLRNIQEKQYVVGHTKAVDVLVAQTSAGLSCLAMLTLRDGELVTQKTYFPSGVAEAENNAILSAFIAQHYLHSESAEMVPRELVIQQELEDSVELIQALTDKAGHKVNLTVPKRGEKLKWLEIAAKNAQQALTQQLAKKATIKQRLTALKTELDLPILPKRIECFDISHTQGEATVASCVVFTEEGMTNSLYRRFNIKGVKAGDDYAAMQQAVERRFKNTDTLPDVLLIDGGKGQLSQVAEILQQLEVKLIVIGIAKGVTRKAGLETLFFLGSNVSIHLSPDSLALHLLQQIRDEAHRFAISGHRKQRSKTRSSSILENIPGIGAKKRKALLNHFGGWQALAKATEEELLKVPGISRTFARRIIEFVSG